MVGVCCGCIAKPASVQPRKTYNILIGQLFEGEPIGTDAAIDSSLRRKIQKLQEYVQANPAKIPKVSRRLMRRIKATLRQPGNNLGFVKVAVHAYVYMLAKSTDDISSYSPSFFAREVVSGPDAVVSALLKDIHIEMRTLGAELLAVFTKAQSQVDNKLDAIESQVPQVCRAAQAALTADRKEQKLQATVERRKAGDKLAVPNPLDLVARRDPAHVAALEVACLRCLVEVVGLCRRSKVLPHDLTAIQAVMLDNLRQQERGSSGASAVGGLQHSSSVDGPSTPGGSSSASAPAGSVAGAAVGPTTTLPSIVDAACYQAMGIQNNVPLGWHPRQLAGQLLQQMGSFTKDIATVHKIMDSFYEYLDDSHRWQEQNIVRELLDMLTTSGSLHQFPIYASLLRHASDHKLSLPDAAVVLGLAAEKGASLDECYSLAALSLALTELPKVWAEHAGRAPRVVPMQVFLDLLHMGPISAAKDTNHSSAMAASPAAPTAAASVDDAAAGNEAAQPGSQGSNDTVVLKEQLAHLKEYMLSAVQLLADQVGTAAELCEALTSVLAAASAELGLAATSAADAGPAETASRLSAGGAGSAAGAGDRGAVVSGGGAAAGDQAATRQATELTEAAAATMMLQCAAAATDTFVQRCGQLHQQHMAAGSAAGQQIRDKLLVLPGGVLPGNLVAAALPLLAAGQAVVRRPVQRILVGLLPAAHKGLSSNRQAAALAEATLQELRYIQSDSSAVEDYTPPVFAAMDQILWCCLKQRQVQSGAALVIGRALLQLQQQSVERGYQRVGGGNAALAHAVLLLYNSQVAALADALFAPSLKSQQLPVPPGNPPILEPSSTGLTATVATFDAAASHAVLTSLEQQAASAEQGQELRAALLQAPRLLEEYGDQLPQLLDQTQPGSSRSLAGLEGAGRSDKPQLTFNVLLTKRMTSLRRDLVHVGDLMRNSIGRIQDITPAASLSLAPSTRLSSDAADARLPPGTKAAGSITTAAPSRYSSIDPSGLEPTASVASYYSAVGDDGTDPPVHELPSPAASQRGLERQELTGAASFAESPNGGAVLSHPGRAVSPQPRQQDGPTSSDDIEIMTGAKAGALSARVAEALKQPVPAGAYVVRDVKISRLAGELEPVLM